MMQNIVNNTDITENIFELTIEDIADCGLRLDKFLANHMPFSRTLLQKWLELGNIKINNQVKTSSRYKTKFADHVQVKTIELPQDLSFIPEDIELNIAYEDEYLLVINKIAGMVVHPAPGNWTGTLLNAILHHYPQTQHVPRAGIVHRLDKMTSGLMVIAKTLETQTALVEMMQLRQIKRQYLSIVHGTTPVHGTINANMARHPTNKTKMAIVETKQQKVDEFDNFIEDSHVAVNGKVAITHYRRLANLGLNNKRSISLVECTLDTGRTHQIRVHMASIGHSLLGDSVYSKDNNSAFAPTSRQALHAFHLSFNHPFKDDCVIDEFAMPADSLMLEGIANFSVKIDGIL
jgi:23S rRNA pseudouridine1911/1915/1917 synthase